MADWVSELSYPFFTQSSAILVAKQVGSVTSLTMSQYLSGYKSTLGSSLDLKKWFHEVVGLNYMNHAYATLQQYKDSRRHQSTRTSEHGPF